ncbi:hypothetical protein C8Q74DRAFT_1206767 [Fomes fomentarius]|nr:hypothetical protein C8Q74DRAFT_1206767 [Fomes fomentarius]
MSSSHVPRQVTNSAWDIYARELLPLGYGYPLWGPEPDGACGEVRLGDVGYIWEGHFNFLFNCTLGGDDPVNLRKGVPNDFEIFSPPCSEPIQRPDEITATTLNSRSVRVDNVSMGLSAGQAGVAATAGIRFMCQEESGAVLLLKRPGHKTYLDCGLYIKRYLKRNLQSWYVFATDRLGIDLEDKDIIFVYGFTKTTVWAEAAFRSGGSDVGLVLSGGALVPSVSGDIEISRMRASKPSVISRSGPLARVAEWDNVSSTDETFDQCIFLNFYKMKKRRVLPDFIIRAAAGDHDLPSNQEDHCDQELVSTTMANSDDDDLQFNTIEEV